MMMMVMERQSIWLSVRGSLMTERSGLRILRYGNLIRISYLYLERDS